MFHGCTRLAVKFDFITGLLIKATEMTGAREFRGVEANIGEVVALRNMLWAFSDAMATNAMPWAGGAVLPGIEPALAQLQRQPRGDPPLRAVRFPRIRVVRSLQAIRRYVPGRVRSRWMDRSGFDLTL
jgi:4-hydroxyphenylacetate 3-monooxygenase